MKAPSRAEASAGASAGKGFEDSAETQVGLELEVSAEVGGLNERGVS